MLSNQKSNIAIVILCLIIFILMQQTCNKSSKILELNEININLNDTLKKSINQRGQEVSKIYLLETELIGTFTRLKTNDSIIIELQKLVTENKQRIKNGGSVTIIKTETKIDTFIKTEIIKQDTMQKDSLFYVFPTYHFNLDTMFNGWIKGDGYVKSDTTKINLTFKDDFYLVLGREKVGFLKYKPFVEITNLNPFSTTKSLRTYNVKQQRPKRFGMGFNISFGINHKFEPSFYIGFGFQYNIIEFY